MTLLDDKRVGKTVLKKELVIEIREQLDDEGQSIKMKFEDDGYFVTKHDVKPKDLEEALVKCFKTIISSQFSNWRGKV